MNEIIVMSDFPDNLPFGAINGRPETPFLGDLWLPGTAFLCNLVVNITSLLYLHELGR
jgi:hypothetical protein